MDKYVYIGSVILLLLGITAAMWFIPFGRDLNKDNQYLQKPPVFSDKH